jgi:small subunit ribosomal protein S21
LLKLWKNQHKRIYYIMRVEVRNDNMDQAIRVLKKKLQQDGLFNELREREYYSTRSEKRRRSKAAAIRRQKREAVKRELEESGNV